MLAFCMIVGMLMVVTPNANATWRGSDFASGTLGERLDAIISNGISTGVSTPFPAVGGNFSSSKMYTVSFPKRKWSGYQCMAYAYAAYNFLFGSDASSESAYANNVEFSSLKGRNSLNYTDLQSADVRFGAYLRTTANSNGSFHASNGHSLLILSYDESNIITLEANRSNSKQYIVEIKSRSWDGFNRILGGSNRYVCALIQPVQSVYDSLGDTSSVTVTFDPNGGYINPSAKSFPAGSLIEELPTPTRSGHVFLGWSTEKESGGMIVTPGSLIMTEDMTLYAVWKSQTVYFDANGGSTPQAAKNVTIGSVYGDLPIPTRSGYTFDGWYTSTSGGTQITSSTIASGNSNITLYAHWSQIPQQDTEPTSFDYSGTFGQKNPFSWALDSTTGTLVISGNGRMAGWQDAENRPWAKIRNKVTKVIVKDGAQNLSQYLVARCENMTSISIPESVTEICDGVFIRAYALESIQLPQGLTKIGGAAFSECTSLRSITIPENVNYIDAWAFSQCTNLQSIYFCGDAPSYFGSDSATFYVDGPRVVQNVFYDCKNLTIYYPANSSGWAPIIEKYTDVTWKTWDAGNTPPSSGTSKEPTPGLWSEWSNTPYQASSTREVETRQVKISDAHTEYRYGRYIDKTGRNICWCGKYLESLSYVTGSATLQYSTWTSSRFNTNGKAWTCGYCSGDHIGVDHYDSAGRPAWLQYVSPNGDSYYWEETRTISAIYETQYHYRDLIPA